MALAGIYFAGDYRAHLVGISVGIDKRRRRNMAQIQSVMLLGDCRPGAPSQK
jgi:hypothetical protein